VFAFLAQNCGVRQETKIIAFCGTLRANDLCLWQKLPNLAFFCRFGILGVFVILLNFDHF
jgi:hypothetical protein